MKRPILLVCLFLGACGSTLLHGQTEYQVLVNNRGANAIYQYDIDGNYLGEFIAANSGGLSGPEDVLFHPDGSVLVTGFNNSVIKRYDGLTGDFIGDFSTGYLLDTPSKMSIGPDSLIYVTQWGSTQRKVVRFDLDGAFVDEFTSVDAPNGLGHFWDAEGRFYISLFADGGAGTVHRFAADGSDLGVFIDSSILQGPTGLWQDANGDIYVQDWTVGRVLRYDQDGQFLGNWITGLTNPEGMAELPNGDLLMGDWGEDAVHRFDADGNHLGHFTSGNGLIDPNGVRVRELAASGVAEGRKVEAELRIVPNIGPGPFELLIEQPISADAVVLLIDAAGRVVETFPVSTTKAVPFRMPVKPKKKVVPGRYHVLVRDPEAVLHGAVTVTE
ncbi:MAG: NHL repeat-containing protein [Flavobacteriales bacterium]|nr:NHL repeat-containing protein [Flavobacteriales bacterium]